MKSALWKASFAVVAIATALLLVCLFLPFPIPDALTRVVGVINLIAIAVLVYATFKGKAR